MAAGRRSQRFNTARARRTGIRNTMQRVGVPLRYRSFLRVVDRAHNIANKTMKVFAPIWAHLVAYDAIRVVGRHKTSLASLAAYRMFIDTECAALCNVPLLVNASYSLPIADSPPLPTTA